MASAEDLVNLAIRKIGGNASPIVSLDSGTSTEAKAARAVYPFARSSMLAEHNWDFATQDASLARMAITPPFGYAYYYMLPADFLRILDLVDAGGCDVTEYNIRGVSTGTSTDLAIATSAEALNLTYIADSSLAQDVNQMRLEFRNALVCRLARDLCKALSSGADYARLDAEYRAAIAQAKSIDSLSGPPVTIPEPAVITVR